MANYLRNVLKYGGARKLLPIMISVVLLLFLTGIFDAIGIPLLVPVIEGVFADQDINNALTTKIIDIAASLGISLKLNTLMIFAVSLIIISLLLKYINTILMEKIRAEVTKNFREKLISSLYATKWDNVLGIRSGEFSNIVIEKCPHAGNLYFSILEGAAAFFYSFIYIGIAIYLSLRLSIVFLICFVLVFASNMILSMIARKYSRLNLTFSNLLSADLSDRLRAAKFIFSSSLQEDTFKFLSKTNQLSIKNDFNNRAIVQGAVYFNDILGIIILLSILLIAKRTGVGLAVLAVFIFLLKQLIPMIKEVLKAHQVWLVNKPQVLIIIDNIENFARNKHQDGKIIIENIDDIIFEKVSFGYNERSLVFAELSLAIPKNKMTALVGISGAGKTTIADLIVGLLNPKEGKIFINGFDIRDIKKQELHKKVSYVSQDNVLFNGTIRDNICIREPAATEEEVNRALSMVALDKFVESLPRGHDTEIGENGIRLSGGQRQRLILTRALIVNPMLLILDEATSQLDVESEAAIKNALESMRDSLTMIVIAHRLSTVKSADLIYVIEDGKVIESGTHEQLLARKGRLYQFTRLTID